MFGTDQQHSIHIMARACSGYDVREFCHNSIRTVITLNQHKLGSDSYLAGIELVTCPRLVLVTSMPLDLWREIEQGLGFEPPAIGVSTLQLLLNQRDVRSALLKFKFLVLKLNLHESPNSTIRTTRVHVTWVVFG